VALVTKKLNVFVGLEVGDGELLLLPQAETMAAAVIASIPLRVTRSFMCVPPRNRTVR
jgi:hypothetical protein